MQNLVIDDKNIAELAAYLLIKAGGKMHKVKLMLLLYLADRHAIDKHKIQLTDDVFISTQNGPALAHTKLLMNGEVLSGEWNSIIHTEANHEVSTHMAASSLQTLWIDDIQSSTLDEVWELFGGYSLADIVLMAKHDLREWKKPQYGQTEPLPLEHVLMALGRSSEDAVSVSNEINAGKGLEQIMSGQMH